MKSNYKTLSLALLLAVAALAQAAYGFQTPLKIEAELSGPARHARIFVSRLPYPVPDIDTIYGDLETHGEERFSLEIEKPAEPFIIVVANPQYVEVRGPFHPDHWTDLNLKLGAENVALHSGRLRDPQGVPITNAEVAVNSIRGLGLPRAARGFLTVQSDQEGRFSLPYPVGQGVVVSLGNRTRPLLYRPLSPSESEMTLSDSISVAGVVLGPEGRPVADAEVTVVRWAPQFGWHSKAVSDERGRFLLPAYTLDSEPQSHHLRVNAEGMARIRRTIEFSEIRQGTLTLRLEAGNAISGSFTRPALRPRSTRSGEQESLVRLLKRQPQGENPEQLLVRSTLAQDSFHFEQLEPGTYHLEIRNSSVGVTRFGPYHLTDGEILGLGSLRTGGGMQLSGRVEDSDGNPLEGVRLRILDPGHSTTPSKWMPEVRSDSRGRYAFQALSLDRYELEAFHPHFGWVFVPVQFDSHRKQIVDVLLGPQERSMQVETSLQPDSLVRLLFPRSSDGVLFCTPSLEAGLCRFERLPEGLFMVDDLGRPSLTPQSAFLRGNQREASLKLGLEGVSLTGRILAGDEPLANLNLAFHSQEGAVHATTDEDGRFQADLNREGDVQVVLDFGSYNFTAAQALVTADSNSLELILPNTSFAGKLIDSATGQPLAKASFSMLSQFPGQGSGVYVRGQTEEDGSIKVSGIPSGSYQLRCASPLYLDMDPMTVEVGLGFPVDPIEIALDRGRSVSGLLSSPNAVPVHEVRVHALDSQAQIISTVKADWRGRFQFTGLPKSPLTLIAQEGAFGTVYGLPASTQDMDVDLKLVRLGRVSLKTPALSGSTKVRLLTESALDITGQFPMDIDSEAGKIEIGRLPYGTYIVRFENSDSSLDVPVRSLEPRSGSTH